LYSGWQKKNDLMHFSTHKIGNDLVVDVLLYSVIFVLSGVDEK
jgi:hypothetical protein